MCSFEFTAEKAWNQQQAFVYRLIRIYGSIIKLGKQILERNDKKMRKLGLKPLGSGGVAFKVRLWFWMSVPS